MCSHATADVDELLAARHGWTTAALLEAEVLRARARPGPLAGDELEEALAVGAAAGWVQPFLGHGPAVTAELSRLPLDDLHPALAEALRPAAALQGRTPLVEQLTPRERTVLELLPTHYSYAQIGEHLFLSREHGQVEPEVALPQARRLLPLRSRRRHGSLLPRSGSWPDPRPRT